MQTLWPPYLFIAHILLQSRIHSLCGVPTSRVILLLSTALSGGHVLLLLLLLSFFLKVSRSADSEATGLGGSADSEATGSVSCSVGRGQFFLFREAVIRFCVGTPPPLL